MVIYCLNIQNQVSIMAYKNSNIIKPISRKANARTLPAAGSKNKTRPMKPTNPQTTTRKPAGSKSYRPMDSYSKSGKKGGY